MAGIYGESLLQGLYGRNKVLLVDLNARKNGHGLNAVRGFLQNQLGLFFCLFSPFPKEKYLAHFQLGLHILRVYRDCTGERLERLSSLLKLQVGLTQFVMGSVIFRIQLNHVPEFNHRLFEFCLFNILPCPFQVSGLFLFLAGTTNAQKKQNRDQNDPERADYTCIMSCICSRPQSHSSHIVMSD